MVKQIDTELALKMKICLLNKILQNTSIKLSQGTQELHGIKRVPIKSIESISFSDNESVYFMTINMKDGANVIMTEFDGLSPEYKAYTQIVLPKNIDNEGLKERLVKAFNHLVEIYTGKIKKEPF